jgi:hypothetical protein
MGEAAHRLGERAEARPVLVRTGLAEARHADHGESGRKRAQPLVSEVPALEGAGAEALDQDISPGRLDQAAEQRLPGRLAERQGDRLLVAGKLLPGERNAVLAAPEMAALVAADRVLDLDHLGAEIAEDHGDGRAGDDLPAIDDGDAAERHPLDVRFLAHDLTPSAQAMTRFAMPTIA